MAVALLLALAGCIPEFPQDEEDGSGTRSTNPNAPVLNPITDQSINSGGTLQFTARATDPNGDLITYTATGTPFTTNPPATFNMGSGLFTWTPGVDQIGSHSVTITATDGSTLALTHSRTLTIQVMSDAEFGQDLYILHCQRCHGVNGREGPSAGIVVGSTAVSITAAINTNAGGMGGLSFLSTAQVQSIADFLATVP